MSEKKYCSHPKWLKLGLLRIRDSWPILLGGFTWRSALGAPPRAKNCERCHFQLFLLLAIFRHPYFAWALSNEQFWINIKQDIKWISGQGQTFNGDDFKNIDEAIGIQAGPSEQKEIWANIALRLSRHKNLYFNFIFSTLSTSLFTYMSTTSHNKGCSYETRKNESISWLSCERPNRSLQPLFFFLTHHQPHYPPPADRICKVIHSDWIRRHHHDHLAKIFRSQHLDLHHHITITAPGSRSSSSWSWARRGAQGCSRTSTRASPAKNGIFLRWKSVSSKRRKILADLRKTSQLSVLLPGSQELWSNLQMTMVMMMIMTLM